VENVRANAECLAMASARRSPAMKIGKVAVQLASATELPDAREKFARLSEAVLNYMAAEAEAARGRAGGVPARRPKAVAAGRVRIANSPRARPDACGSFR
jgi:ribose 1,5-bisphosphokinase PhnN